jgi:hypothetical protein
MRGQDDKGSKPQTIRTFEDLDAWKVCGELRTKMTRLSRTFPKEGKFGWRTNSSDWTILTIAHDEQFVEAQAFRAYREEVLRAVSVVNGLIRYLSGAKRSGSSHVQRITIHV